MVIRAYDEVRRGRFTVLSELRLWLDTYGLTPKGAMDRRWLPPEAAEAKPSRGASRYQHLKVLDDNGDTA